MTATVKREMHSFLGKPRKYGDIISAEELSKVSPQTIKALVNNGNLEVDGMAPGDGANAGTLQHIRARQDAHDDRVTALEASNAEMRSALDAAGLLKGAAGAETTKSKRDARKVKA